MPMKWVNPKLASWASEIDELTMEQALRIARLPVIAGHVALMPDAHLGRGATVGSVIATEGAVIPSAVGVDLGCGMAAVHTTLRAEDLPDDLGRFMPTVEKTVPAGWASTSTGATPRVRCGWPPTRLRHCSTTVSKKKTVQQFGSLGSGNHFFEICLSSENEVWLVIHSGSRGIGNILASQHIDRARGAMKEALVTLDDPELAWFVEGTPEFATYVADMLWAQSYARANRDCMLDRVTGEFLHFVGRGEEQARVNCHHNFCEREHHHGRDVWVTRKGAIKADVGDWGIIPGSMGARSYIVRGRGQPDSFRSCAHGAGRRMSRNSGQEALHRNGSGRSDGRSGLEPPLGSQPGRRDPRRLQAHRAGDGRPGRPGDDRHRAAPDPQPQGNLRSPVPVRPTRPHQVGRAGVGRP